MRIHLLVAVTVLAAILAAERPTSAQAPSAPAAAGVLQTQDVNVPGVVAELIECKRKDGVLSVKVRFRNTSSNEVQLNAVDGRNYDEYYVTAKSKKYFILRDSEKTALAPATDGFGNLRPKLPANGAWTWWAKYPAPPADVKSISYFTPLGPPFEDVSITDM